MARKKRKAGTSPAKTDPTSMDNTKKTKRGPSDGASNCASKSVRCTETASNASDVGDFGGSMENVNNAGPPVKMKLPPLVVKNVPLQKLISDLASIGISAEYELRGIGIKVHTRSREDYKRVAEFLRNSKLEFSTHDIPGDKPFKVIIRGLPNFDVKLIGQELKDRYKLVPSAIFRIKRKDEQVKQYSNSLFLVHFPKDTVSLNALKAVQTLLAVRIRWEKYRGGRKDVTQCQRCLNFGHGTRNCFLLPRCSRCAMPHISSECTVEDDRDSTVKCANCGADHQGNDRSCPKRETYKQIRKKASTSHQPRQSQTKPLRFTNTDFPPLQSKPIPQPRLQPSINPTSTGPPAGPSSPSPPGWRPITSSEESDKFSPELLNIFEHMTVALRRCRNKPEQIQVLGTFIIQYGS